MTPRTRLQRWLTDPLEAALLWPKVRGVLELPLPPLATRTATPPSPR